MGTRHLVSNAQEIVNQMRRVIHTHWPQSEESKLIVLQKCGVAIMSAIENKGDLASVLNACQQNIEEIVGKEESPTNNIATEE